MGKITSVTAKVNISASADLSGANAIANTVTTLGGNNTFTGTNNIEFSGISQALIGSLVMAKVVILMEYITLGKWVQKQPAIVDVLLRTLLYTMGVLIVIVLEKAFESRHKADNYGDAILYVFKHKDIYRVWATTIGSAASIFVYNAFSVVQRVMGKNGLAKLFFKTPLEKAESTLAIS